MILTRPVEDVIRGHEGLRFKLYKCTSGKNTIGYGRNLDDTGITKDEAEYLFKNDVDRSKKSVLEVFGVTLMYRISYNRYAVLVDMMYNLGLTRFKGFEKMIQSIHDEDYNQAANEMSDSRWATQVGKRADELIEMMRQG